MRILSICVAALLLSGCVESDLGPGTLASSGASSPKPKAIVVSDFVVSSDVLLIDRGYTARLERKIGAFPTFERKPRTIDRVNDEIVATVVATLREAGLEAAPGAEESLSASSDAVIVKGRLRPADAGAKKNEAGIGGGKSNVTADMTLSKVSALGQRDLMSFSAGASGKLPSGKAAAADNATIAGVLAAGDGAKEKLSPDVESASRKLGRAIGDKIVAYAKAQGWLNAAGSDDVAAKPAEEKPAPAKPAQAKTSQAETTHADTGDKAEASPLPGDEEPQMVKLPATKPKKKPAA
ncbi:hypothetical protein ASD45_04700 [Pseudolabrys sp. Root1462]|uniref:hypothetical protein n=1 Tax=Pseudolabrys sp. Root1462 TaxID=1736466 RepID=UPI000702DA02|nr:hypothetical protein [Pseudolabrys sp. Root1462]KQZ00232.1 hypothetical protein ASD45_04700 [Pseudolabrys sp. Root1462]